MRRKREGWFEWESGRVAGGNNGWVSRETGKIGPWSRERRVGDSRRKERPSGPEMVTDRSKIPSPIRETRPFVTEREEPVGIHRVRRKQSSSRKALRCIKTNGTLPGRCFMEHMERWVPGKKRRYGEFLTFSQKKWCIEREDGYQTIFTVREINPRDTVTGSTKTRIV